MARTAAAQVVGTGTRAGIYARLRDRATPATVRDVAADFDLHPNVARTHLQILADAGLVEVGSRRHPGGGRPAKVYTAVADVLLVDEEPPTELDAPAPDQGLIIRLLMALLEGGGAPSPRARAANAARAAAVAAAEGRRLVAALPLLEQRADLRSATEPVVRALRAVAPTVTATRTSAEEIEVGGLATLFTDLAELRPELGEALERGLIAGAFAAAGVPVTPLEPERDRPGLWRVRPASASGPRTALTPSASVDTRGLPRDAGVNRAMDALVSVRAADLLEVLTEGPGAPAAFARWADRAGHQLLAVERAVDPQGRPAIRLLLRKGP